MSSEGGILKGVGRRITELLREAEPSGAERTAGESPGGSAARHVTDREVLAVIRAILGSRPELAIGRVNLIHLDQVRSRLGKRWAAIADRVDGIVRRAIEQHLDLRDVYTTLRGHRYLIVFVELPPVEAGLKCAAIREEINRRLMGEETGAVSIGVQTASAVLDGTLEFVDVPTVPDMLAQLYALTGAPAESPPQAETPDAGPLDGVQIVYRPMWDVGRNIVSTFVYVPAVERGRGNLAIGEDCISGIEDPSVCRELDLLILRRAIADLVGLAERRQKLLLVAPIHFESLATLARRESYLEVCRIIPSDLAPYLIFELVGAPDGVPQSRLLELTSALKPYCRSVLLRVSLADPVFRPAGDTGVGVVGVSLTGLRWSEKRLMAAFDRFCEGAQKAGLSTYVQGLRTMSMTTAAVAAGFGYIDGDTVMSVVDEPPGIFKFDARVMVRRWSKSGR